MEVIRKGKPYWYYDLECPKCHSTVRVGESELHYYEDCYDLEMAETDSLCPNCMARYIKVPKHELEKYRVKGEEKIDDMAIDANRYYEREHRKVKSRSLLRRLRNVFTN